MVREYEGVVVVPKSISRVTSPQYACTDGFKKKTDKINVHTFGERKRIILH